MGINNGAAHLLVKTGLIEYVKQQGEGRILTLGRQTMSIRTERQKSELIMANENIRHSSLNLNDYCENLLYDLGATSIESLDYSDFEGANHILNLNTSFENSKNAKHLKESFDLILDYGTSEHVFQPAQSIANSIYMLKTGGLLNLVLPISGWLEHGFYQFSPIFFRSLDSDFLELKRLYIFEPYKTPLKIWDGMKIINRPLYQSLNGRFSSFAIYEKKPNFNEKRFLSSIQQGVYASAWKRFTSSKDNNSDALNEGGIRTRQFRIRRKIIPWLAKYRFFQRYMMYRAQSTLNSISKL